MEIKNIKLRRWIKGHFYQGISLGLLFGLVVAIIVCKYNNLILGIFLLLLVAIFIDKIEQWSYG